MEASPAKATLLRRHGLQVTAQRLAILRAVAEQPHSTAAEIGTQVRQSIGSVSAQAVYDALGALAENGIIRRIQPAGSPARYEDRVGDNHHHLICRSCGQMVDVDCAVGFAPCLNASEDAGYEIDEAEVIFWGRCPACTAAAPTGTAAAPPEPAQPPPEPSQHPPEPLHPPTRTNPPASRRTRGR